jgi:hypothetical protein
MRTIILHYHLFKNAGTSVDHVLRQNFPSAWVSQEFPGKGGNNTADVSHWITSSPQTIAFSSHTMQGPIPEIQGIQIVPVILWTASIPPIILSASNRPTPKARALPKRMTSWATSTRG